MIQRAITPILRRFAEIYPLVGITGPRQSGKTTLARDLFPHLPYVSLENLDIRATATADPRGFLAKYSDGAIFDEVQHAPDILSYLQQIVDEKKDNGDYIITGSQNFALSAQITQSLSGRIGMATLLPLSSTELGKEIKPEELIFFGGYPRLYQEKMKPLEFYPSYINTYLERDVRQLKNVEDLHLFQTFLRLCAGRVGQLLNITSLAQDCGISHTTARGWLSILEASYLVFFLQPFHNNFNKRLIKMPKLYFYDTGLACSLLAIEKSEQLYTHYARGALYENLVITELLKGRLNRGLQPNLYFWRDHTGHEVDCLAEWGGALHAIEIKMTQTFSAELLNGVKFFTTLAPDSKTFLIYNGDIDMNFQNTKLLPFAQIDSIF